MNEAKPQWMTYHEEDENRRFSEFAATLKRIEEKLDPISETYRTASLITKWIMSALIATGIIVGIVVSIKTNFLK